MSVLHRFASAGEEDFILKHVRDPCKSSWTVGNTLLIESELPSFRVFRIAVCHYFYNVTNDERRDEVPYEDQHTFSVPRVPQPVPLRFPLYVAFHFAIIFTT